MTWSGAGADTISLYEQSFLLNFCRPPSDQASLPCHTVTTHKALTLFSRPIIMLTVLGHFGKHPRRRNKTPAPCNNNIFFPLKGLTLHVGFVNAYASRRRPLQSNTVIKSVLCFLHDLYSFPVPDGFIIWIMQTPLNDQYGEIYSEISIKMQLE